MDESAASTLDSLHKRGQMLLEDEQFRNAKKIFSEALSISPEFGAAHIGLAMAHARISSDKEFFWYCVYQKNQDNTFLRRARQFADADWSEFFTRVDEEARNIDAKKEKNIKTATKVALTIILSIILILSIVIFSSYVVYSPAQQLYEAGQYKDAYDKAAEIAHSNFGGIFGKDKIEKYAYAYLCDYLTKVETLATQTSATSIVKVVFVAQSIHFISTTETDTYRLHWSAQFQKEFDEVDCAFSEDVYTTEMLESQYISHGDFSKSSYIDHTSIATVTYNGYPKYSNWSALHEHGEVTISTALSLIENTLGIPAEHLGFYSYKH